MEGTGAVEEFEVEGGGGLAVDFSAGTGLHGHCFWGGKGVPQIGGRGEGSGMVARCGELLLFLEFE